MFRKLHLQMTLFCTAVTGAILLLLTAVCFIFARQGLLENDYAAFLSKTSSVLSYLQSQEVLSLQWINQQREKNNFTFIFYDNGKPLLSQELMQSEKELGKELIAEASKKAEETYGINLFQPKNTSVLPSHAEFSIASAPYYITAGIIPKTNGSLSFLAFYSTENQSRQLLGLLAAFVGTAAFALILIAGFSYFFTGRLLQPIAENNKKQTFFIASASHELRAPLAVILSGAEALEKAETSTERSHFTALIRQEGTRMQRLISDMLLLANSDANALTLHCAHHQADELLLTAYEKYELLAQKKQISLLVNLPDAPDASFDFVCDYERLLQVLSILLDNALFYTPAGGKVTLSLVLTNGISFQVTDSGPGIPDDDKAAIFHRFYRADTSRTEKEHFGLGLCIAKELVQAHHGKIFVTDAPGGGACFTIHL